MEARGGVVGPVTLFEPNDRVAYAHEFLTRLGVPREDPVWSVRGTVWEVTKMNASSQAVLVLWDDRAVLRLASNRTLRRAR